MITKKWNAVAAIFSATAFVLLLAVNLSQVGYGIARSNYMVQVDVTGLGKAMQAAPTNQIGGLYFLDDLKGHEEKARMGQSLGIRDKYRYGLHRTCGYRESMYDRDKGIGQMCNTTDDAYGARRFRPFDQLMADVPMRPVNYKQKVDALREMDAIATHEALTWEEYAGIISRAGSFLIMSGTIAAFITMVLGFISLSPGKRHKAVLIIAAVFGSIAATAVCVGAKLWQVAVLYPNLITYEPYTRTSSLNINRLGMKITFGSAYYMCWAAFGILCAAFVVSIIAALKAKRPWVDTRYHP